MLEQWDEHRTTERTIPGNRAISISAKRKGRRQGNIGEEKNTFAAHALSGTDWTDARGSGTEEIELGWICEDRRPARNVKTSRTRADTNR